MGGKLISGKSSHKRIISSIAFAILLPLATAIQFKGEATPVSQDAFTYASCGRVFSDPHAFWPAPVQAEGKSPFAKGNAECSAAEFITFQEMVDGLTFLEKLFPDFVQFYQLERDFGDGSECDTSTDPADFCSAGLPRQGIPEPTRIRSDLYMLRVTDERASDEGKKNFVFPLSIHGIERAGAEGGIRAAEDLATWAFCEAKAKGEAIATPGEGAAIECEKEGEIPHPILETQSRDSLTAGTALRQAAAYFIFPNPDGWRRGDPDNLFRFYQRYNGNGVDLNRDWPANGYVFRPYTPWSEPESRSFGRVLKSIRPKWDGGIDLHGMLVARAFSYTLLGASQRDYGKNQRILQTVKGAWNDAEKRLSWSPLIIPNDQPQNCSFLFIGEACDRMYGVQWGTVWDTIDYTTTGSLGDWIDSTVGLGGDGIDNEMSMSHHSNCGTGACYLPEFEQLHIDGNKSLIFGMINFTLQPEDNKFRLPGKVAYIYNPQRIENLSPVTSQSPTSGLDPQPPIKGITLDSSNEFTYEFSVKGIDEGAYNGGLEGVVTPKAQLQGSSASAFVATVLEYYEPDEPPIGQMNSCGSEGDGWEEINRYYNQTGGAGPITYFQSGQAVHANSPNPGRYRICLDMSQDYLALNSATPWRLDITFTKEKAWENPGQLPYSATNMKFFEDLSQYTEPNQLQAVSVDDVLSGRTKLETFRSVIVADNPFPGYVEPVPDGPAQPPIIHEPPEAANRTTPCGSFVAGGPCSANYEFQVKPEFNNQRLVVTMEHDGGYGMDLQWRSRINGEWHTVGTSFFENPARIELDRPRAGDYRLRVTNAFGAQVSKLEITFSNQRADAAPPSRRSQADLQRWTTALKSFVEGGGNLVLTDGGITNLAYMGVVPRKGVIKQGAYAGFVWFTRDGQMSTFEDPLAKGVKQPGSAEGPNFRHQTYEPVPIGYEIPEAITGDIAGFAPVWGIDQFEWEKAGGRTVGLSGGDLTSLGEISLGKGVVRIFGAVLPMPSNEYYHPFGLDNYAVTYSGYQVLNNLLQWERPASVLGVRLAATGPRSDRSLLMIVALAMILVGMSIFRFLRRPAVMISRS